MIQAERLAARSPSLKAPQNEVVNWLRALPSGEARERLLAYFREPLPRRDLQDLRKVWHHVDRSDAAAVFTVLETFSREHRPVSRKAVRPLSPTDLQCVAWMRLLPVDQGCEISDGEPQGPSRPTAQEQASGETRVSRE